jgi:hypothetical protein
MSTFLEYIACIVTVIGVGYWVTWMWQTRRQPVRDDSPTSGPWVPPDPFWKD